MCMWVHVMQPCHNDYTQPHGIMTLLHAANIWPHDASIACACVCTLCSHVTIHTHMHMQQTGFNQLIELDWKRPVFCGSVQLFPFSAIVLTRYGHQLTPLWVKKLDLTG